MHASACLSPLLTESPCIRFSKQHAFGCLVCSRLLSLMRILVFAAQSMNVEGLTRENVASHLQKYRLQLKKDGPDDGPAEERPD